MMSLFHKKKSENIEREKKEITFSITGMHCSSCAMNIDGALEDTQGVLSVQTDYARSTTTVQFDDAVVDSEKLMNVIKNEGYTASVK